MSKQLNELFAHIMSQYGSIYDEVSKSQNYKHPFSAIVRTEVPSRIKDTVDLSEERYKIKGSCGAGRWTTVPWVAIFDKKITESAQKGVYIVYLFNKDSKKIYLTLNQGATSVAQGLEEQGNGKLVFTGVASANSINAIQRLRSNAEQIQKLIDHNDHSLVKKIQSGSLGYDAGAIFSKEYILDNMPDESQLIRDLNQFIYLYSQYYEKVFSRTDITKMEANNWWPSLNEYDPRISKKQWLLLLNNKDVFTEKSLFVMASMYDMGGEASCIQLEEKYGKTSDFYRAVSIHLAERVIETVKCPLPPREENSRLWPVLYVGREARQGERGNYVWKLRTELYDALKEFEIGNYLKKKEEEKMSTRNILEHINAYIAAKGFSFDDGLVENYYLSLKSKPFVILAGTSGTGKTRLVRLFAEAIGATSENGRYKLVSVRPDWSDSSDLFGHVDLNGKFVPGAIIDFVNAAEWDSENPYFLCLDEMNLARVEYYLSDILSIIETREFKDNRITTDQLISEDYYGSDEEALEKYGEIRIPENLYIVGTVNMDETTFPFSRKVLDRANTIEFSTVDFLSGFDATSNEVRSLNLGNDFMKADYVFFKQCADDKEYVEKICVELQEINKILEKANAHVGYRVRDEIVFYMMNNKKAGLLSEDEAFDNEIMQKILPRIQGSSAAIKNMLCELFKRCAGEYESYQTESDDISSKMFKAAQRPECKYKKSAEKIAFMVRRFEEDGFTAYWL